MGMLAMGVAHFLVVSMGFAVLSLHLFVIAFNVVAVERATDSMETSQKKREAFPAPANLCGKRLDCLDL